MGKILQFDEADGHRRLRVVDATPPVLRSDEVLYRVESFALNRSDLLLLNDEHYSVASLPARICSEAAGVVQEIGSGVTSVAVGDRVSSIPFHHSESIRFNVAGEFAVTPERYLLRTPQGLNRAESCAITMQYLTAYYALHDVAALSSGETLLVSAGSSSAALAAIQIGKLSGATVIATTRDGSKKSNIEAAGADIVLVSDHADLASDLLEATAGRGAEVAYDPVGGSFVNRYISGIAFGGRIVLYGTLTGSRLDLDLVQLVRRNVVLYPYSLFNFVLTDEQLLRGRDFLTSHCGEGGLRPIIDREFAWAEALAAFEYLERHEHTGKVVVSLEG